MPQTLAYDLVIFDWDGTLVNSLQRIVDCMHLSAQDLQLPKLTDAEAQDIIGLGLGEAILTLYPQLDEEQLSAFKARYAHHYTQADAIPSSFYPGVPALMDALKDANVLLSVATGKSRRGLNRVMGALEVEPYFVSSRCADETASKPDPLMINELLAQHNLQPHQAVVVGDTEFDMGMAENAGVARIGVSWGAHARERLERYQPIAVVDSVSELQNLLL